LLSIYGAKDSFLAFPPPEKAIWEWKKPRIKGGIIICFSILRWRGGVILKGFAAAVCSIPPMGIPIFLAFL
jgi:hypothetical protein